MSSGPSLSEAAGLRSAAPPYGGSTWNLLRTRVHDEGPASARLILEGELDLSGVYDLECQISKVEARRLDRLVVDLTHLQFIDSAGIACLLRLLHRTGKTPTELRFVPGPPTVQRTFDLCGLSDVLPFEH